MFNKKKIDIKDLPFAYMEEGMCTHCGCRLSTAKMNGKFICCDCSVLYKEKVLFSKWDELVKLEDLTRK